MRALARLLRAALAGPALLLAMAVVATACAPPGDGPDAETPTRNAQTEPVTDGENTLSTGPAGVVDDNGVPQESTDAGTISGNDAPHAAVPSDVARNVVLHALRGGAFVPRCPECGETQPSGSVACAGCGQTLAPWRQESRCPACESSGSCRRCGDDRPCLSCETSGRCATCEGGGRIDDERCDDCLGRGSCRTCGGDGVRSGVDGDFPPGESNLPGICTTCLDGSGACPSCGGGADACITCDDDGLCPDCRGTGACMWDRGDGLCATCDGAGHEVLNGPPGTPADRDWTLRRDDGTPLVGDVEDAPSPDLTILVESQGTVRPQTLVPSKVHPVSYYLAARDFTALDDVKGRLILSEIARERGLLALASRELSRAVLLDPGRTKGLNKRRREVRTLQAQEWMTAAREASRLGDRERARTLFAMVPSGDRDSAPAVQVALRELRETEQREEAGLDDEARGRARQALTRRIVRTVARAQALTKRARLRLAIARDPAVGAVRERLAFAAADRAAQEALALVRADARRRGAADVAWPVPVGELLAEARATRARIALDHASAEVVAGRYELARRLVHIARALDPDRPAEAEKAVLEAAERGMMRRGVQIATPPPNDDGASKED